MAARRLSPRSSSSATVSIPRSFSRSLPRSAPGGRSRSSRGRMKCSSSAMIFISILRYASLRGDLEGRCPTYVERPRFANRRPHRYGPRPRIAHRLAARMFDVPIANIALHHIALPPRREHKWTGLTEPIGSYLLVEMTDAEGLKGWGEAPVLKDWGGDFGRYFGESPGTTVEVVTRHLAPAVKGCQPGEIVELHARMDHAIKGYPYAKAAVEFAAYDLAGKQCDLPVHRLLGGALRRRIPVTHSIGLIGFEEAEREAAQVVAEGIRTIKIKVGVDPERDVEMVRRIRDTVGTGIALCVDANQGYRTPGEAIRTLRRMERFDLIYFEQPVEGIERLAQVARAIDVPVMADES